MWYNRGNIWFWHFSKLLKIGGGAHYYWPAATASKRAYGIDDRFTNITSSICPAGWTLPTGLQAESGSSNGKEGQIGRIILDNVAGVTTVGDTNSYTAMTAAIMSDLTSAPLSYTRSGWYEPGRTNFNAANLSDYRGLNGGLWGSTVYSSQDAYNLYFRTGLIYPNTLAANEGHGFPVRCVLAK